MTPYQGCRYTLHNTRNEQQNLTYQRYIIAVKIEPLYIKRWPSIGTRRFVRYSVVMSGKHTWLLDTWNRCFIRRRLTFSNLQSCYKMIICRNVLIDWTTLDWVKLVRHLIEKYLNHIWAHLTLWSMNLPLSSSSNSRLVWCWYRPSIYPLNLPAHNYFPFFNSPQFTP